MSENKIIKLTADYVKKTLSGESSGHDWWHIYRVWNNAKQIAQFESVDLLVVELAAFLHDIFDWKFADGNVLVGSEMARKWLDSPNVKDSIVNYVC
ncbi:HD domain-containing protein [Candidatus Babeliales bacterium]|nr:HD domain-containing protein [Candidatus Babeliales bacterium]